MGIYVYMIRGPKKCVTVEIEKPDKTTEVKEIAQFAFLYKPWWNWDTEKYNRPYQAVIARMEKLWEKSGKAIPDTFAVIHKKLEVGASVYQSKRGGFISCYDTPDYGGAECIGVVKRIF